MTDFPVRIMISPVGFASLFARLSWSSSVRKESQFAKLPPWESRSIWITTRGIAPGKPIPWRVPSGLMDEQGVSRSLGQENVY